MELPQLSRSVSIPKFYSLAKISGTFSYIWMRCGDSGRQGKPFLGSTSNDEVDKIDFFDNLLLMPSDFVAEHMDN